MDEHLHSPLSTFVRWFCFLLFLCFPADYGNDYSKLERLLGRAIGLDNLPTGEVFTVADGTEHLQLGGVATDPQGRLTVVWDEGEFVPGCSPNEPPECEAAYPSERATARVVEHRYAAMDSLPRRLLENHRLSLGRCVPAT